MGDYFSYRGVNNLNRLRSSKSSRLNIRVDEAISSIEELQLYGGGLVSDNGCIRVFKDNKLYAVDFVGMSWVSSAHIHIMQRVIDEYLQGSAHRKPGWYAVVCGDVEVNYTYQNMDCSLCSDPASALNLETVLNIVEAYLNYFHSSDLDVKDTFSISDFANTRLVLNLSSPMFSKVALDVLSSFYEDQGKFLGNAFKKHFASSSTRVVKDASIYFKGFPPNASTVVQFLKAVANRACTIGVGIGEVLRKDGGIVKATIWVTVFSARSIIDIVVIHYVHIDEHKTLHLESMSKHWNIDQILNANTVARYILKHPDSLLLIEMFWRMTEVVENMLDVKSLPAILKVGIPELKRLLTTQIK